MLEGLRYLFSSGRPFWHTARDLLDIAIVAFFVYRGLLVLRGTRAQQMGIGMVVISGFYALAKALGLVTLHNMMNAVLSSIVLIVVVVFQNDIRRALMRMGDRAWLPGLSMAHQSKVFDEVVAAATDLARHRIGALIALEQDANLNEFIVNQGIKVDAAVTRELLVTIFLPENHNKLHDGSVIIRNLRVASAGVFFPMPESRNIDAAFGSRHRAGIGITDETDAVVVIVSEERGTVSVCYNGNLIPNLDGEKLRTVLLDLFGHKKRKKKRSPKESSRSRVRGALSRAVFRGKPVTRNGESTAKPPQVPMVPSSAAKSPLPAGERLSRTMPPTVIEGRGPAAEATATPPATPDKNDSGPDSEDADGDRVTKHSVSEADSALSTPMPPSAPVPRIKQPEEDSEVEDPPLSRPMPQGESLTEARPSKQKKTEATRG